MPAMIALLEKGIGENPDEWRLYQDIGYIYWQEGKATSGQTQTDSYANRPTGLKRKRPRSALVDE